MKNKAPIVLFTYNRPSHTERTIEALKLCDGASTTSLYIYSDGAKNTADQNSVAAVRQYIHQVSGFASVSIIERPSNVGLAANIISGVSEVINKFGRVIVLEDDIIPEVGFIEYMNNALEYYQDMPVWSIGAYSPIDNMPIHYQYSTYMIQRNCSWGWATWLNRWNKVDWNLNDYPLFASDPQLQHEFNLAGGTDLSPMMKKYHKGIIKSWSIRFCYSAFKENMPCVFPSHSIVKNAGADGSGSNMIKSSKYNTITVDRIDASNFCPSATIDPRMLEQFRKKYNISPIRRLINSLTLCIVLLLCLASPANAQLNTNRLMQVGRNAIYFEDYVLGMQYFNRVINVKPYLPDPYYYRGVAKYYLDDLQGAANDCEIAYGINPFLIGAYNLHGIIMLRQGKSKEALEDFHKGLEVEKDNINLLMNCGIANINLDEYDEAISCCDKVLEFDSRNVPAVLYKGIALVQKGDSTAAMTEFKRAVSFNSYSPDAYTYLGMLNYQLKNYDEALACYNKLTELRPTDANVFVNRAITYYNLDDFNNAFKDLEHALHLDKKNIMALSNIGMLHAEVGRVSEAIDDFSKLLALDNDNDMALMNRAILYIQIGEMNNALADLNIVIARHPEFGPAYYQRAIVKRNLNDPKGSEIDYMTAYTFEQERIKRGLEAGADSTSVTETAKADKQPQKNSKKSSRSKNDDSLEKYDQMVVVSDFADNDDKLHQDSEQIRGRVQDRDIIIDLEPMFEISFFQTDTILPKPKYYAKSIEDLNNSGVDSRRMAFTNREGSTSQEDMLSYFSEIRELSNRIDNAETSSEHISSLYLLRGTLHNQVMSYNQAISDYNVCLLKNPNDINALINRATTRFKTVELIRSMDNNVSDGPSLGKLPSSSSNVQMNTTILDLDLIMTDLIKVSELDPNLPIVYYNMSLVCCMKRNFDEALSLLNKAIDLDKDFAEAYFNRGIINIYKDNIDDGQRDLSKAGELGIFKAYNVIKRYASEK
ncbi:MAG: tetratricopeptide repeat protein [Bacteroidia bacterium]|nr:tetratricopeptide repeat protein [Bacteroidia bacterium]